MINRDKIPTIPCRECLVRAMCRSRLRVGILSLSLNCSILNKWLDRDRFGSVSLDRLFVAYNELSLTNVSNWREK
jgi:hypothetical protein